MLQRTSALALGAAILSISACSSVGIGNEPVTDANAEIERFETEDDLQYPTYSQDTIVDEAENLFGQASAEVAEVISDVFSRQGQPQAYIAGEEVGGAVGIGVTYGKGYLYRPNQQPVEVYWQGPSLGFDVGADASKVFTLVYDLGATENLYQRIPGGGGNIFFVGGVGAEAMSTGDFTIVPVRTGIGARSGVSVEYMHFSDDRNWVPF
jgi:hypothetical protein